MDRCADTGDDLGVDEVNDIDWCVGMRLDGDCTVGIKLVMDVDLVDGM